MCFKKKRRGKTQMAMTFEVDSKGKLQARPVCSGCGKVMDCSLFSDCEGDDDHVVLLEPDSSPDCASLLHYHRVCAETQK
jgi:hypothetical protein